MIEVSEKFKNAVRQNTRKYEWYGSITTKAGKVHEFTAKDIVKAYLDAEFLGGRHQTRIDMISDIEKRNLA